MTETHNDVPLIHNEAGNRFEMHINGHVAFIEYSRASENLFILSHTEVPPALEGRGIGKMLVEKALAYIEEQQWKIVPLCPFVHAYIKRHPEWDRIVHHKA